ncbi:peptidase S24/S26A/S26B/S26C [Thamnidium elegans]|nr:peptidase S24/S26A/S26B/S26C [Thamnidium elegans]
MIFSKLKGIRYTASVITALNLDHGYSYATVSGRSMQPTSPVDPKLLIIKRIIALPGDTVKPLRKDEAVPIPAGHAWVEGDEAFHSRDSNAFGTVPIGLISAKVTYILWPPSRFGPVEKKPVNKDRVQMNVFKPGLLNNLFIFLHKKKILYTTK